MVRESQKKAGAKWDRENTRQVKFKFMLKGDADILEKLDSLPNKSAYVKELIRADIAKGSGK